MPKSTGSKCNFPTPREYSKRTYGGKNRQTQKRFLLALASVTGALPTNEGVLQGVPFRTDIEPKTVHVDRGENCKTQASARKKVGSIYGT